MAFEHIKVRVSSGMEPLPAAMTLSSQGAGGGGRAAVVISLRQALVAEAGFDPNSRFNIFLGKDEDAGKLRIVAAAGGNVPARTLKRTGSYFINIGHVPAIGTTSRKRMSTQARVTGPGCVDIDIPDFDDDGDARQAEPPAPAPPAQPPKTAGETIKGMQPAAETIKGITLDLTVDNETVTFKGKTTEVTTYQARLIQLLARPRPAPVAASFLVTKIWDKTPADAEKRLREMASDLQRGLSPIGLDLHLVKGVGYQLKDL